VTGRKFTRTAAAKRLGLSRDEIDALIANGSLSPEWIAGDHEVIPEQAIEAYERKHPRPTVARWSAADDPEAFADRGDYTDTPNDEGDEQQ
jgi:hypothetical protein